MTTQNFPKKSLQLKQCGYQEISKTINIHLILSIKIF